MNNLYLWRKRQLIESGELTTWSRRGAAYAGTQWQWIETVLQVSLGVLGLRSRGERNALSPVVNRLHFTIETLPPALDGFTILHLSDLHADGLAGLAEALGERLQEIDVDLAVLTGDYRFAVSGSCGQVADAMERILAKVKARHGILGILGNHDSAELVPLLEGLGVRVLLNDALEVVQGPGSLWVVGVDDPHYYGCDDLPGALRDVPQDAFKVLLVHTPEMIPEAAQHGIDLYLCGHTHGGQICLPLIGPLLTQANCPRKYARGAWRYEQVHGYTNTGAGVSGVAVRFLCPPEIGLIELHAARRSWDHSAANLKPHQETSGRRPTPPSLGVGV